MPTLPSALSAYAFLLGSWGDEASGARESWVVAGERLVGVGFFAPGQGPGFEILEVVDGAYVARPGGGPPVSFRATKVRPDRAIFENPEHDWPTRIAYRRPSFRELEAKVSGPGGGAGWQWTFRDVLWDDALLAAERSRGGDPLAADVSSDGALGFTVTAAGVTIWEKAADGWVVASE